MRVGVFACVAAAILASSSASRADQCFTVSGDGFLTADGDHEFRVAASRCDTVDKVSGPVADAPEERRLSPLLALYETAGASVRITTKHASAVRTKLPSPAYSAAVVSGRPSSAAEVLVSVARTFDIDPALLSAIVRRESGGRADAISAKGARGLLQVMPATAARFGVGSRSLTDPRVNLEVGATYLKALQGRYGANLPLVLAAYNAGEDAVARYGSRVPPFRETRRYVTDILNDYQGRLLASAVGAEPLQ